MKKLLIILFLSGSFLASMAQTTLDSAINFSVKDVHGNSISLYDLLDENKIVVIDFFSTA
ncbi:MAG: peroxiredoxin family protein [Bacteroidetes bacterium]|nr:peroxiredoxin family protein [Bacteroidota bacterium]